MKDVKFFGFLMVSMLVTALSVSYFLGILKEGNFAQIRFFKENHSFDTLYSQDEATVYFKYTNIGNVDLHIYDIETTCGCTIPEWNTSSLIPGKSDSFKVEYNIDNKGFFTKEILVHSNSKMSPKKISISGYVPYPHEIFSSE
jgi:hypothetical protein